MKRSRLPLPLAPLVTGSVLLLGPAWFCLMLAAQPGPHGTYGLLIGFAFLLWGSCMLLGWVMVAWPLARQRRWPLVAAVTLGSLLLNAGALVGLAKWKAHKARQQFLANSRQLAGVAEALLRGDTRPADANAQLVKRGIRLTAKLVFAERGCRWVFFYESGALDSQVGYFYVPAGAPTKDCLVADAVEANPRWYHGAL